MTLFLVRGFILETTAVHTIQTSMMMAQAIAPSRSSIQTPPTVIDITDTGSKNRRDTWVWLLTLEVRECGPVSARTGSAIVNGATIFSLQGSAFGCDWQVRVTFQAQLKISGLWSILHKHCKSLQNILQFPTKIPPKYLLLSMHVHTLMLTTAFGICENTLYLPTKIPPKLILS